MKKRDLEMVAGAVALAFGFGVLCGGSRRKRERVLYRNVAKRAIEAGFDPDTGEPLPDKQKTAFDKYRTGKFREYQERVHRALDDFWPEFKCPGASDHDLCEDCPAREECSQIDDIWADLWDLTAVSE